ncbi:MAG: glutaredoxin 3 [Alistipes senegalensis]|nr:glutaredoxin 3 [Oxalobacter formigenes]MCM1280555.1 glutaredoxin 3 [Alistipes senegalensis]
MAAHVVMYTKKVCPYCVMAEKLLQSRGVQQIEKIFIDGDERLRDQMMAKTGRRTVPQIYIGERHVGGYDDLAALDKQGSLVSLLEEN